MSNPGISSSLSTSSSGQIQVDIDIEIAPHRLTVKRDDTFSSIDIPAGNLSSLKTSTSAIHKLKPSVFQPEPMLAKSSVNGLHEEASLNNASLDPKNEISTLKREINKEINSNLNYISTTYMKLKKVKGSVVKQRQPEKAPKDVLKFKESAKELTDELKKIDLDENPSYVLDQLKRLESQCNNLAIKAKSNKPWKNPSVIFQQVTKTPGEQCEVNYKKLKSLYDGKGNFVKNTAQTIEKMRQYIDQIILSGIEISGTSKLRDALNKKALDDIEFSANSLGINDICEFSKYSNFKPEAKRFMTIFHKLCPSDSKNNPVSPKEALPVTSKEALELLKELKDSASNLKGIYTNSSKKTWKKEKFYLSADKIVGDMFMFFAKKDGIQSNNPKMYPSPEMASRTNEYLKKELNSIKDFKGELTGSERKLFGTELASFCYEMESFTNGGELLEAKNSYRKLKNSCGIIIDAIIHKKDGSTKHEGLLHELTNVVYKVHSYCNEIENSNRIKDELAEVNSLENQLEELSFQNESERFIEGPNTSRKLLEISIDHTKDVLSETSFLESQLEELSCQNKSKRFIEDPNTSRKLLDISNDNTQHENAEFDKLVDPFDEFSYQNTNIRSIKDLNKYRDFLDANNNLNKIVSDSKNSVSIFDVFNGIKKLKASLKNLDIPFFQNTKKEVIKDLDRFSDLARFNDKHNTDNLFREMIEEYQKTNRLLYQLTSEAKELVSEIKEDRCIIEDEINTAFETEIDNLSYENNDKDLIIYNFLQYCDRLVSSSNMVNESSIDADEIFYNTFNSIYKVLIGFGEEIISDEQVESFNTYRNLFIKDYFDNDCRVTKEHRGVVLSTMFGEAYDKLYLKEGDLKLRETYLELLSEPSALLKNETDFGLFGKALKHVRSGSLKDR